MIPKKIHYCWFGGNELPELAKQCISSWKKYLPDYEIIEWNESNYDIEKNRYIREAYSKKKYAFVSDFARFDILYNYGGIYFDTDVEIIKDITNLIEKGSFVGLESPGLINTGLGMAGSINEKIFKEVIDSYEKDSFINSDGTMNLKTVVYRVSEIFEIYGLSKKDEFQFIRNINIYPVEYFCPKSPKTMNLLITNNTYTIHHYDASWIDYRTRQLMIEKSNITNKIKNQHVASVLKKFCVIKKILLSYKDKLTGKEY